MNDFDQKFFQRKRIEYLTGLVIYTDEEIEDTWTFQGIDNIIKNKEIAAKRKKLESVRDGFLKILAKEIKEQKAHEDEKEDTSGFVKKALVAFFGGKFLSIARSLLGITSILARNFLKSSFLFFKKFVTGIARHGIRLISTLLPFLKALRFLRLLTPVGLISAAVIGAYELYDYFTSGRVEEDKTKSEPEKTEEVVPYKRRNREKKSDIVAIIRSAAEAEGVDPELAIRIAEHESGLNPNAKNPAPGATASGLFQIIRPTFLKYNNDFSKVFDPKVNARVGVKIIKESNAILEKSLGRKPQYHESYLAHFAGPGIGKALSKNLSDDTDVVDVWRIFTKEKHIKDVVESNKFLRGKKYGDLIKFAKGAVGTEEKYEVVENKKVYVGEKKVENKVVKNDTQTPKKNERKNFTAQQDFINVQGRIVVIGG